MSATQGVTFTFPDVTPGNNTRHTAMSLADYVKSKETFTECDTVMMATESKDTCKPRLGNGLLGTMYAAYSSHCPMVLRPDDIFLGIVIAFGWYVTNNSEETRHLFVDHTGRKELTVRVNSPPFHSTSMSHWDNFIELMTTEIQKNTKTDVTEWSRPTFSTTTKTDVTAAGIALMATVQNFFSMRFILDCGLSKVTLQGTLDDWKLVRQKAEFLVTLGIPDLTAWARLLMPVLDQFVSAYAGNVNADFWQRICTSKSHGSGGQQTFRGWFLVFAPFDSKGKYILDDFASVSRSGVYAVVDDDNITTCTIDVPAVVTDTMTDTEYNITLSAGVYMTTITQNTVSPCVGWAMILNKTVTIDDMRAVVEGMVQKNHIRDFPFVMVEIAFDIATTNLFPNKSLLDFAKVTVCAHQNRRLDPNALKRSFVAFVKKMYKEKWDFASFISDEYVQRL